MECPSTNFGSVLGALIYLRFIPIENAIIGLWAHSDDQLMH